MTSQRPFTGLLRGRKGGHFGSKIDFFEIDPEGGLGAWGAHKTPFYGGLSMFWPPLRPFQDAKWLPKDLSGACKGAEKGSFGIKTFLTFLKSIRKVAFLR